MADNLSLRNDDSTVVGTVATLDVGGAGVHYPVSAIAYGTTAAVTVASTAAGLPVQLVSASTASGLEAVITSGTVGLTTTSEVAVHTIQGTSGSVMRTSDFQAVFSTGSIMKTSGSDAVPNGNLTAEVSAWQFYFNGTNWDRVRGDLTDGMLVNLGSNNDVTGDVAHDSTDLGNPLKLGAKAVSAEPTAVAANDRVNLVADLAGKLVTSPYSLSDTLLNGNASFTTTGSDTAVIAAQGAGVRIYVTSIQVTNSSTTVTTQVVIKDGATEKMRIPAPKESGGIVSLPAPLQLTANTALNANSGDAATTVYVSAQGYSGR